MYFGTQYYRAPFPCEKYWVRDLDEIKKKNFNVVKLWAVWNWVEKKENIFYFKDLDKLVDLCEQRGLKVIINTICEGAPTFTEKYSDSLYKKADGTLLTYSGPANIPSAGWPGLCMDSPKAKELMCKFIRRTSAHFASNPSVIAIDVWNEPHLEPSLEYSGELLCYCDYSITKFINWLKIRYNNLDNLNKAWFRSYINWQEVKAPIRFGTTVDMIDFKNFWLENLQDWLKDKVTAAKQGAPNKTIQTHVAFSGYLGANNNGGLGNELGDEFLLAKEVDAFGLSTFPLWLLGKKHNIWHFMNCEIVSAASREKPFYQMELQGGAGKQGLLGGKVPSYADINIWNWNVIAAGGKGVLYWQYAFEPSGTESPGFGLVDELNFQTPRAIAASECALKFNKSWLTESVIVPSINGILLSRSSDLFCYSSGYEEMYTNSIKGVYEALFNAGIPVRFVHEDYLDQVFKEGLQNLYVPMGIALSSKTKKQLFDFTKGGGHLIIEGSTGLYSEKGITDLKFNFLNQFLPNYDFSIDLLQEEENIWGFPYKGYIVNTSENNFTIEKSFGSGKITWFRGFLSYNSYHNSNFKEYEILTNCFNFKGYSQIENLKAKNLVVRLLTKGKGYCLIVINSSNKKQFLEVKFKDKIIEKTVIPKNGIFIDL